MKIAPPPPTKNKKIFWQNFQRNSEEDFMTSLAYLFDFFFTYLLYMHCEPSSEQVGTVQFLAIFVQDMIATFNDTSWTVLMYICYNLLIAS